MKACKTCKVEQPLGDFYKHAAMSDGHLNICKECTKDRVKSYREANIDRIREYDKARDSWPHRVAARREYIQTPAGKRARQRASLKYRERDVDRYEAKVKVGNAVRAGKLIRPEQCSECSSTHRIEAHHDDYNQPLNVRWLCSKCHKQWHRFNEPIYGENKHDSNCN